MRHTIPKPESITLQIAGTTIAGIRHRQSSIEQPTRLLCLHGWLDNANSFVPMMPYLPDIDLVAIDLPGHGFSSHLDGYGLADMVYWTVQVTRALQWSECHLMGHSLGGCFAPMIAVARPELVQSLILIEASGAMSEEADAFPQRLQRALQDRLNPDKFASRTFADKQSAVNARLKAARMNQAAARLIIDRQLIEHDDGWHWRFDPRLRMASPQYLSEAQVMHVLESVSCPALSVIATDGFLSTRDNTETRLSSLKDRTNVVLGGHHHVHMDTPEPVAAAVNQFLGTRPALGG